MGWMPLRYAGKCQCGAAVPVGARALWTPGQRILAGCPACGGGRASTAPPLNPPAPAAGPQAPRAERPVVETPSVGAAQRALAAHLARLDPDQRAVAAVRPVPGSTGRDVTRVLAGAGSGKTTALVGLVGGLVGEGMDPSGIVAVTFTRKGGDEIRQRLARVLPPGALARLRHCGTFDSMAVRALVTRDPLRWDMDRCVSIGGAKLPCGAGALWDAILTGRKEGVPGLGVPGLNIDNPEVAAYTLAVDVARAVPLTDREIDARVATAGVNAGLPRLSEAWDLYKAAKRALGAWDFLDARHAFYRALTAGEMAGAAFVAVDEAQDNSPLDLACAVALAGRPGATLVLVGDVRQAIFEWRGGDPEILATADTTLKAATLTMGRNYRSGSRIVEAGNLVAAGQTWDVGEASTPARATMGSVTVEGHEDPMDAAEATAEAIQQDGGDLTRHAILCRTNAQAGLYEAALLRAGVPCAVVGGSAFFARREVKTAMAYLTLSEGDDTAALALAVRTPKTYLGAVFLSAVAARSGDLPTRLAGASSTARGGGVAAAKALAAFLRNLRAEPSLAVRAERIAVRLSAGGHEVGGDAEERGALARALAQIAARFPSVAALALFAARCEADTLTVGENDDAPAGRVTISTIHKAKGREWDVVYIDATGGAFPHSRSEAEPRRAAEERRLFYVAVTRAKDTLRLTYCVKGLNPRTQGGPSAFLALVAPAVDPKSPPAGPGGGEPAPEAPPAAPVHASMEPVHASMEPVGPPEPILTDSEDAPADPGLWPADRWADAAEVARCGTAAEPESQPGAGGRYVEIEAADFEALLAPLGFTAREEAGQVVFTAVGPTGAGTAHVKVYSSIPAGDDAAREVGTDSIKVAALWHQTGDPKVVPMHRKLPYAARTRGWRGAVLARVSEVAHLFVGPQCQRCGAPTVERTRKDGGGTFRGCVRWSVH